MLYAYHSSQIKDRHGDTLPTNDSATIWAIPILNAWYVSPFKILGANYGADLSLWLSSSQFDFPRFNVSQSSFGYGDMFVKPVELGWHTPFVDAMTGFALWIPTGTYTPGGNDNSGQGQWGFEFSAGGTAWFDRDHHFNFGTKIYYDIYTPRRGTFGPSQTQLHTGNILTLMGGAGYQFLGGAVNVGIPYFVQWKVTQDTLPPGAGGPVLPEIQAAKDWSMGLGGELDFFWSKTDGVTLRFVQGFSGRNTTNGQTYFLYYNHVFAFGSSGGAG